MEIVVKGRNQDVGQAFREHSIEKLQRIERLDHKVIRLDVEVGLERNPRQSEHRERVELTCHSKGPVIRAEASAHDCYAALDFALDKLESRLRKAADRRRIHHGHRTPEKVAALVGAPEVDVPAEPEPAPVAAPGSFAPPLTDDGDERLEGGLVVRKKLFAAHPMTLDQALHEMELVGHDFYLYDDSDCGRPSVAYRRRGYDYGVIRLERD